MSLICAIDNLGVAYFAVSTSTTDSDVFITFLMSLSNMLDYEKPEWRTETIILLDNALYHKSEQTAAAIKKLGIRVCYSGPYAFSSAPVEQLFALLKRGELNPLKLELGKR